MRGHWWELDTGERIWVLVAPGDRVWVPVTPGERVWVLVTPVDRVWVLVTGEGSGRVHWLILQVYGDRQKEGIKPKVLPLEEL